MFIRRNLSKRRRNIKIERHPVRIGLVPIEFIGANRLGSLFTMMSAH